MAKKNSTKTATKEAMAASEPRILNFGQWTGVNIKEAPYGWQEKSDQPGQSDLPDSFLMIQDNIVTTSNKALETRLDEMPVCKIPPQWKSHPRDNYEDTFGPRAFTGVTYLYENRLYVVLKPGNHNGLYYSRTEDHKDQMYLNSTYIDEIWWYDLGKRNGDEDTDNIHIAGVADDDIYEDLFDLQGRWHRMYMEFHHPYVFDQSYKITHIHITDMMIYGSTFIALADMVYFHGDDIERHAYFPLSGSVEEADILKYGIQSATLVPDPTSAPTLTPKGDLAIDENPVPVSRISVVYCYSNKFGPTLISPPATVKVNYTPVEFHGNRYIEVSGSVPIDKGITGVDMYCSLDENQDYIFIGHVEIPYNAPSFTFNWMGALNDTTQWTSVSLTVPTSNDTLGADATHVDCHDGRLFFYGGSKPNRLYIGGDPGNELSISRGVGGAFVDLDPGTNLIINATHKFKTYNGASIVTIMCGSLNTTRVKRFNLLETNVTVTNELQSKGYEAEEISNVIGCNSPWGSGVFADGLYSLSRYGLGVTTMQMEESNTLKVNYVSDAIQPIFTDEIGTRLKNARLVYIDEIIYFCLAKPDSDKLDNIIFSYDINQKAWYTLSVPNEEEIIHIFPFDYDDWWEGIGVVTADRIYRIPLTGSTIDETRCSHDVERNKHFPILLETAELGLRIPPQIYVWLAQLEFRFDWIIGLFDIEIFGVDYYGRHYRVLRHVDCRDKVYREYPVWIRVDKNVQTYKVRISGQGHFHMSHFMSKTYQQSDKIAIQYGYDSHNWYQGRDGGPVDEHHYLNSYNNLREAIVT